MEIQWKWLAIKTYSKSKWVCVCVVERGKIITHFFSIHHFQFRKDVNDLRGLNDCRRRCCCRVLVNVKKWTILHILFLRRRRRRCSCLLLLLLHTSFAILRAYVTEYVLFQFYSIKSPISSTQKDKWFNKQLSISENVSMLLIRNHSHTVINIIVDCFGCTMTRLSSTQNAGKNRKRCKKYKRKSSSHRSN